MSISTETQTDPVHDSNLVLNFGKYKGKNVCDLLDVDDKYISYLLSDKASQYLTPDLKDFIVKNLATQIKLCFGKHAYKTYPVVKSVDPQYFQWLLKQRPEDAWLRNI